jgi:malonyl-CoA/methylmalonyl-CoA synthetase
MRLVRGKYWTTKDFSKLAVSGEILPKTTLMILIYLGIDIARKEGDYYFILGRASIDIIKSGGYKISALDIEREMLGLDYIAEAMVVGVEDEEFGQRVAACVVLREDLKSDLTIEELRADLRTALAGYKMPTLLRVVKEIRKNATGKVIKKVLVGELFPPGGDKDIQQWKSAKAATPQARL